MRVGDCQEGRTLIEIIGVISIAGVLIAGAVKVLDKAFLRYRLTRVTQQVVEVQKAVAKRFIGRREYEGLTLQLLKDEGLMPADILYKNKKFYHRLGGQILLNVSDDKTNYKIIFRQMPKNACIEMATQNWGLDPRVTLMEMTVGSKNLKWRCTSSDTNCITMPLSVNMAYIYCQSAPLDISWTYY